MIGARGLLIWVKRELCGVGKREVWAAGGGVQVGGMRAGVRVRDCGWEIGD